MPMTRPPYSSGFREQMVELVRSGRSPDVNGGEIMYRCGGVKLSHGHRR